MLFKSLTAAAALAGTTSASPLLRRQGGGSGLPANATLPQGSNGNITYQVVPSSSNGSSYLNATVQSIPQGVNNTGSWNVTYTNGTEPYPGAHLILGNPTKNGTNTTMAWPGQPAGGLLIYKPTYQVESNFDFQSLNLALNQELIELDLFHNMLARFSTQDFEAAGLTADDRFLIEHMADQEIGHAIAITNMLGVDRAAKQCVYQYPFNTVKEAILFSQLLTRWGEAGVYGFLGQLDSRPAAQILLQSITTEARQQMIFRQFQGLPAMPEWFETGLPQSYAWTLLSPYIQSCPPNNPRIEFTRFPLINITNQPYALDGQPGINSNYTLTEGAGRTIQFTWEPLNKTVGYDGLYKTQSLAGEPKFMAFIDQLNVTYAPLQNISNHSASAVVPNGTVFPPQPQVVNSAYTVAVGLYQAS
ncbi:Protein rds1 [Rhodotorula toruloides]|nr:Protein rds1 [Rhodotorula toruloides]